MQKSEARNTVAPPVAAASAIPTKCAACSRPLELPAICTHCRCLYSPDQLTHFELFGLPAAYDIDVAELRRRYFRLCREIHPDRLAGDAEEAQRLGLRISARTNQAFEVLLDPALRAEYLLEIAGGKSAAEDKTVPQEVLTETLLLREAIEEAKAAGDSNALAALRAQIESRHQGVLTEVAELARRLPGDEGSRAALRRKLNSMKYYQRMLEQL